MGFDLASAKPDETKGFDLSSATPVKLPDTSLQDLGRSVINKHAAAAMPVSGSQHFKDVLGFFKSHPFTAGVGALENTVSGIGAGVGSLADTLTGSDPGTHNWAYQPRTEAGQQLADLSATEGAAIGRGYDRVLGTGPLAATVKERIPQALGSIGTVLGAKSVMEALPEVGRALGPGPLPTPEDVVSRLNTQQSTSAASAAPSLTNVSNELRGAISQKASKSGGVVNPQVLERHVEADTLPVPVRLTEGQATQDPMVISQERNTRGQSQVMVDHLNDQNGRLAQNVQAIRDEVGPEVFTTNATEHGDALISAYKAKDAAVQADIKAKYKALADANGGDLPVDGAKFVETATAALKKQMKAPFLPGPIKEILNDLRQGEPMTIESFENLRTSLAAEARKAERAGDGNAAAAVSAVRNELENLPITGESASIKALADTARSAAKARFDALRDDPAYKAAVHDTVTADKFVNRFVIRGARDDVAQMRANLTGDDRALQTIGVATVDHLRDAARLNPHYEGNFAAATFNRNLQALAPKLRSLVSARTAEQLDQLGKVARYTTDQPAGSFVNNSNSAVAAAADYGGKVAEHAVNTAAHGLPVGTIGRRLFEGVTKNRNARRAIAPGAGLDRLQEGGLLAPRRR